MAELLVKNPYSEVEIAKISIADEKDVEQTFERAEKSFSKWRQSPSWRRSEVLLAVASEIETRREEFARLICQEAGKPISYADAEVDRAIGVLRWAAGESLRFSGELLRLDTAKSGRDGFGIHTKFPRGIIFGITPFNFPLNLVIHKIAPAIATGCSIIIKPSPFTPLTTLKLTEIFEKLEPGLVQCLVADDAMTEKVTRSKEISMISFTGSARVGQLVQKQAYDKPVTLELGGNAWVIVTEDIPSSSFAAIAKKIASGAFGYAGQSCISVQNVAIDENIWESFSSELARATEAAVFGDTTHKNVISGPVINAAATQRIKKELEKVSSLAKITTSKLCEGKVRAGEKNLIAPTLVISPEQGFKGNANSICQEEIFAPIMIASKYQTIDALVQIINSSRYGLQAGVFSNNLAQIEKLYREVNVGGIVVNDVPTTRYDHQPYGGVKESGTGREGVRYAMDEMTYSKFLSLSSVLPV